MVTKHCLPQAVVVCLGLGACQPASDLRKSPTAQPLPEAAVVIAQPSTAKADIQTGTVSAASSSIAATNLSSAKVTPIKPTKPAPPPALAIPKPSAPPKPVQQRSERALEGQNRLYDRSNPAYSQLQKANQALVGFPADRMGRVDWVAVLRQGKIKPRAERLRQGQMEVLRSEIIMTNTREMPHVRFPHSAHTEWLACKNCHDAIFKPVQGAHRITMDEIFKGRYCGVCHDRVSFSVFVCERCHSVTHAGSPEAWWTQ